MCMGCSRLRVERKRIIARHGYKGLADRAYEDAMTDLEDQWNALPCRLMDQDYWRNSVSGIRRYFTSIDPAALPLIAGPFKSPLVADFSIKAGIADYQDMYSFNSRPLTVAARFNQVTNGALLEEEKRVQLCAGDKFGEFEGHRAWLFDLRTGLLKSCWQDQYVWHPAAVFSANEEVDDFGPHGIHGFKSEDEIERYASAFPHEVVVFGRVRLWGDVIEHDRGYRAEFARIVGLDRIRCPADVPASSVSLAALRRLYNVEEPNGN